MTSEEEEDLKFGDRMNLSGLYCASAAIAGPSVGTTLIYPL